MLTAALNLPTIEQFGRPELSVACSLADFVIHFWKSAFAREFCAQLAVCTVVKHLLKFLAGHIAAMGKLKAPAHSCNAVVDSILRTSLHTAFGSHGHSGQILPQLAYSGWLAGMKGEAANLQRATHYMYYIVVGLDLAGLTYTT